MFCTDQGFELCLSIPATRIVELGINETLWHSEANVRGLNGVSLRIFLTARQVFSFGLTFVGRKTGFQLDSRSSKLTVKFCLDPIRPTKHNTLRLVPGYLPETPSSQTPTSEAGQPQIQQDSNPEDRPSILKKTRTIPTTAATKPHAGKASAYSGEEQVGKRKQNERGEHEMDDMLELSRPNSG